MKGFKMMRKEEIYKKEVGVLLDKVDEKFYVLYNYSVFEVNEVGARIIDLCNGKNSIDEITEKLAKHFQKEYEIVYSDVMAYIDSLKENRIVEICNSKE